LEHVLGWLTTQGARRIVLALGYRSEAVLDYLATRSFPGLEIVTVIEEQPLGTSGAIANASGLLHSDPVIVMNGDTHIEADLRAFLAEHEQTSTALSMICVRVSNAGRYGRVEIDFAGNVLSFREKDLAATEPSWINAGVYLLGQAVLKDIVQNAPSGSLEHDVLGKLPAFNIHAFRTGGGFLDIGTPEDLATADRFFSRSRPAR
jgi:mannose-1-phosphate guanylyltransferase